MTADHSAFPFHPELVLLLHPHYIAIVFQPFPGLPQQPAMLHFPSDIIKISVRPGPRVALVVGLEPCLPLAPIVPGQQPAEPCHPRYTVLIPWHSPYHSSLQYMAQILKLSCLDQKKSFGTSAAGLLSGIPGPSGPCFLAARYSLFFLQHCSQRALFGMAGSRRHLVQRPFSLACCRISRCLRLYSSAWLQDPCAE